jgi:hypothetical protein
MPNFFERLLHMFSHSRAQHPPVEIDYSASYLNRGTFILGSGKSGTTLLQALFDGHPDLIVLPIESGYYLNYPKLQGNFYLPPAQKKFLAYWLEKSKFAWMSDGVYTKHNVEEGRDFTSVNFQVFQQVVQAYNFSGHTRKRFLQTLLEAYRQATAQDSAPLIGFLEKTPAHLFHIAEIREDFADANIIHVLRNPYDNYYAYRTNAVKNKPEITVQELLAGYVDKYIAPSFEIATQNEGSKNYKIVRYEDLVTDTAETMRGIAADMQLTYTETLQTVTLGGKAWTGNSSAKERFNDVSASRLGHGIANIPSEEKDYIKQKLGVAAQKFGYELDSM